MAKLPQLLFGWVAVAEGAPSDLEHAWGLALLTAGASGADARLAQVVPGSFDQQGGAYPDPVLVIASCRRLSPG